MANQKKKSLKNRPQKSQPNLEKFKSFYDLMKSEDLLELEIRDKDFFIRLSRQTSHGTASPTVVSNPALSHASADVGPEPEPSVEKVPEENNQFHSVASPLAGVFYRSPSPASDSFVKKGDKVARGQILCIIEAMKVMNEIHADRPCVIKKILIENGNSVSQGQNLFLIDPIT